jgi:hypothetical protein
MEDNPPQGSQDCFHRSRSSTTPPNFTPNFTPKTSRQVVAVTPDVSAIEAMALMHERHISAVAVVDSVGKIIGERLVRLSDLIALHLLGFVFSSSGLESCGATVGPALCSCCLRDQNFTPGNPT